MTPTSPLGEFELIEMVRRRATAHPGVRIGIGDDCAVVAAPGPGREWLVTTDMLMEGRHFRLDEATAEEVGYKALAVNLSDIAAMAGEPVAAFAAVALPRDRAADLASKLVEGMRPLAERCGVALAGGDTNAWDGPLVICMTILGRSVPPGPVTRSGAQPGDVLFVTGPLGGSLLGRHLRPEPRLQEAQAIHGAARIHAMIDLSDGLSSDLPHILAASGGLGATLDAGAVPVHPDARELAGRDGASPLDHALHDGEDFELCLAVGPEQAAWLEASPPPGLRLWRIGTVEAEPGLRLRAADGSTAAVPRRGFDHLR